MHVCVKVSLCSLEEKYKVAIEPLQLVTSSYYWWKTKHLKIVLHGQIHFSSDMGVKSGDPLSTDLCSTLAFISVNDLTPFTISQSDLSVHDKTMLSTKIEPNKNLFYKILFL